MNKTHTRALTALGAALLLGGCGGSDGPPAIIYVAGTDVPVSATQSAAGALTFTMQLAASSSDTSEPIVLGSAELGTDDTAEPAPV